MAGVDSTIVGKAEGFRSLPEVFRSVSVPKGGSWLRRFFAFAGPGFLVSVGYMDPGNWGTDLAGGSKFGYALLWVIFVSNIAAQFLQILCARMGLVTGKDVYKRQKSDSMRLPKPPPMCGT